MEEVVPILLFTIVIPLAIVFHYITKWKKMKLEEGGTSNEEVASLMRLSDKLEDRVKTLEKILDSEVPDWRRKSDDL